MPSDDTQFLKQSVDVLSFFTPGELERVAPDIRHVSCHKGETVIFRGQITEGFYVVKAGSVAVVLKPKPGRHVSETVTLGPGDFFGEMSLLEETAATATVRAAADGTEILTIPSESFAKLLDMRPPLRQALLEKIAARRLVKA